MSLPLLRIHTEANMTTYSWQVTQPKPGESHNRTQLWALLVEARDKIRQGLWSVEGAPLRGPRAENAALSENEEREVRGVAHRLSNASSKLDPNVLDRLAREEGNDTAEKAEAANLPVEVYEIVESYYGDVYTFVSQNDEARGLVLGFAILQRTAGISDEDMGDVIKATLGRSDRHGDRYCRVWTCPVCEGHDKSYRREHGHPCRRCCGWGYVFGDEPVEEIDALNAAQAEEQEALSPDRSVDA